MHEKERISIKIIAMRHRTVVGSDSKYHKWTVISHCLDIRLLYSVISTLFRFVQHIS